jgi:hypothetical protein
VTTVNRSTASKGETLLLSRVFLEGCLEERLSQEEEEEEEEEEDPIVLDSRQREFLEVVARQATFRVDVIEVPKELLEAFLAAT